MGDEEANRIAEALGSNSAVILQNHGLLTVGKTVDEAAYLFGAMDRACHGQSPSSRTWRRKEANRILLSSIAGGRRCRRQGNADEEGWA